MKEKKPFKVGAEYRLKEKYIDDFNWSISSELGIKPHTQFTFTVERAGDYVYSNGHIVAYSHERHMFTRVDNK